MWSFLKHYNGAQPGKRKTASAIQAENVREKHEKEGFPECNFNQIWCKGRLWLKYNKEKNDMTCTLCTEHAETKQSSNNLKHKHLFISGCNNFRISTVTDHEKRKGHLDALQVKHAKDQPEQTEGHKTLVKLNEQIQKQFINVHAIVKHNRPISDFVWLNDLDKAKGFDYGQVYNNQSTDIQFLESIANVERNKDLLPKVHFFYITMDGSTDDASIEQESFILFLY
jgi:hypothetical protein